MFITESTKESFEMSIAIQSDIIKNLWAALWYKTYIYLFIHIYKADCYIPLEFMRTKFQQLYWEIITANPDYSIGQGCRKTSDLVSWKQSSHFDMVAPGNIQELIHEEKSNVMEAKPAS